LTKGFKGLLIVLAILALLLGGISYVVLGLALLYAFFYGIAIRKGKATLKTDVNTYTIKQKDKLTFLYEMDVDFALPFVFQISLASPYYFVPVEGEKNKKIFVRKEHLKGVIRYSGNRRGVYKIGTFDINISDPLGFFKRKIRIKDEKEIYVFPYIVPFERLNIYLSDPISGLKAKYQLNMDYTSIAGVRDYTTNDALSMIHWKQTAHRNKLMVKELDFTASKRIEIVVNLYKKKLQFQDSACAIAASIANYANEHHLPFGLIVNGGSGVNLKIGKGDFHLVQLFKSLAMADDSNAEETVSFIQKLPMKVEFGGEVFFIDQDINEASMLSLMKVKYFLSRLNIVLLPDGTFVLPHEKPPHYYFKEAYYMTVLGRSKEALAKEGIFVYPILGKDYARKLEMIKQ
jgi:uncharacterized protein (DUF58 family)